MSIIQGTSKAAGGAVYEIDQSIRFNDNDSAYLTRTPASDGNRQTMTFSWWMKRGNLDITDCRIFTARDSNDDQINFRDASDYNRLDVYFDGTSGGRLSTSQVFRDVSAWYHCVVAIDTTQSTASDRVKIYVNGDRVTDFDTEVYPSLNKTLNGFNNNAAHAIGARAWSGAAGFYDGYLAEINFIDGTALDASSFGEYNDDGVWIPKAYDGSYGTNGFYITGADSADLGADDSGNGNDFTSSGLTAADQVTDSPTDNYGVMNPLDNGRPSNITLSDGNLTAAFSGAGYQGGIRSSIFFDSEDSEGWYAECTLDSLAIASIFRAGVANAAIDLASTDAQSNVNAWAYSDQGAKLNNSYTTGYGSAVTTTDVVGIAVRNGKIYFAVNNVWQGSADPVTESNPAFSNLLGDVAFCQSTNTGGSYAHTATWNFGQTGFTYTPPTGFKALSTANLPTPSITDGSAYFQTSLWNGNSSTQTITQSGNSTFEPGMIWSKGRDNVQEHVIFDQVRGATKYIQTDNSGAEGTQSGVTAFNSDGFDLGSWAVSNGSGQTHVGWQWKANGAGSSNTDGDITSTVSANTTSGFSIVKWTGTGANTTLGHGLGVAPKMILVKNTGAADSWVVYHEDVGATKGLTLDTTATPTTASTFFNNTAPTSSVFSVGSGGRTNQSTKIMIAYCFAEVEGFSSFGSYTGNGSATDGPFVYTGFTPEFIMVKNINTSGTNWDMLDATRETFNTRGNQIFANSSAAEANNDHQCDFLSNGFKWRNNSSSVNASGATYIVMAFAESPFKTATAR
jgi:hypothetical protein